MKSNTIQNVISDFQIRMAYPQQKVILESYIQHRICPKSLSYQGPIVPDLQMQFNDSYIQTGYKNTDTHQ